MSNVSFPSFVGSFTTTIPAEPLILHLRAEPKVESVSEEEDAFSEVESADENELLDYDFALLALDEILKVYDRTNDEQAPFWSDALSLQIFDWGKETVKTDTLSSDRLKVIQDATNRLHKLVATILIDPVDLKPLQKPVIYDELFMEDAFAKACLKYLQPNVTLKIHQLALDTMGWVSLATHCIENEKASMAELGINVKIEVKQPESRKEALSFFTGAAASFSAVEMAAMLEDFNPEKGAEEYLQGRIQSLRAWQKEKCEIYLEKWQAQKNWLQSEWRMKNSAERVKKIEASLNQQLQHTVERIERNHELHRQEVELILKETAENRLQQIEIMQKQIELEKLLRAVKISLMASQSRNQQLTWAVQSLQRQMEDERNQGGCTIL